MFQNDLIFEEKELFDREKNRLLRFVHIVHMTRSWINPTTSRHFFLMQMNQGSHGPKILVNIAN